MKKHFILFTFAATLLFSCEKERSLETGNPPPGTGTGGGGTGGGTTCSGTTVMKLKKLQSLTSPTEYLGITYTASGAVDKIEMNIQLSDYLTAKYIYENNRIKEAAIIDHKNGNAVIDTVVYRYNNAGKVDSLWRKTGSFNRALKYDAAGKLNKLIRYESNGDIMYYWQIISDAKGNITKAEEWWNDGTGSFDKESTYIFSRDDKKNPFDGLGVYMLELDDEYSIFSFWGANNYIDQTYQDHTIGFTLTTGMKNRYNANCYPSKAQNTISGMVLFPTEDDWEYQYQ